MITVNGSDAPIHIGLAGENLWREVTVDVSDWLKKCPTGEISAVFERPDGESYVVPLTLNGNMAIWRPAAKDTVAGYGNLQLQLSKGVVLGKSHVLRTICTRSLQTDNEIPEQTEQVAILGVALLGDLILGKE